MAWAPGKGVKGKDYKDYWDADLGVSYIPNDRIPEDADLDALEEGGMIDDDSMPERLKELQKEREKEKLKVAKEMEQLQEAKVDDKDVTSGSSDTTATISDVKATVPPGGTAGPPPPQPPTLSLMPSIVQPQFTMPVPGW